MKTISDLPIEILLHIFKHYLKNEPQAKLFEIIANVSPTWEEMCYNSYLWTKFDGTLEKSKMITLCNNGSLSNTKKLIVSEIQCMDMVDENKLFSGVQNVESIDFSQVSKLSKDTLPIVGSKCVKLKEITIGKPCKMEIKLHYDILDSFFVARGSGMVKISISDCCLTNFELTIRCILDCCPNLEHLHLMRLDCTLGVFPTKYFQIHCPKLKVLHLDHKIRIMSNKHATGFPDMEAFVYVDGKCLSIADKELDCILFNSPKLKFLSLTNCDIKADVLCSLPACSVEYLFLPRSKVCNTSQLSDVFKKWCHTLKEVDISYGRESYVNKAVLSLIKTDAKSPLEYLNVSGTQIICSVVEEIMEHCINLETLKLDGCECLDRGMKKTYNGKKDLADLIKKIEAFKNTDLRAAET